MKDVETAITELRQAGMRATPQRRAVLEELLGDTTHPSADELARRLKDRVPGISLSTVYKTLHELAELGLVLRLDGDVMRFDPGTHAHGHLVCDSCGRVVDLDLPGHAASGIREMAGDVGHRVERVTVTCTGRCATCSPDAGLDD